MTLFNKTISASLVPKLKVWRSLRVKPDPRADEIAAFSHELRNSLAVVRNAARLLRSPAGADMIDRARVLIERHVGHMNRYVEDLMGTSAQSAEALNGLQCSHLDLRTIVEQAVASIAPDITQRSHSLVVHLPDDAVWVHVDASRLEQAFTNLLINAAKYTPNGGEIVVTLERDAAQARLRIRDSGIGIESGMLPRVFDMYAQADAKALCSESGSGIGLALVRDLVEKHGGTVQAASAGLGLGSEFTVVVPALWGAH